MKLTRKQVKMILQEEKLNVLIEALDDAYKSEMKEFAETKGGKSVMQAGSKILSAGRSIRDVGSQHTGGTRRTLETVANFVEGLGSALERINSLDEGEATSTSLPTIAEYKGAINAVKKLEK